MHESAALSKTGRRWRVTIARPGQGSSGFYPEEVLREFGPAAFPAGTKSFFTHDAKRDPRDMVGTFPDGAFWNEDEGELQADLEPFPRYRDVLDQAGSAIEASIHARANKTPDGKVRELLFDRANSVDLVAYAGLEGSGLKFQIESLFVAARDVDESSGADPSAQTEKEGKNMDEKQAQALVAEIAALKAAFDAFVAEHKAEAQGVADEKAVETAASAKVSEALEAYIEKETAINGANLLPKQAAALKARALAGEDIAEALVEAKELAEEARNEFSGDAIGSNRGIVVTEGSAPRNPSDNFLIGRWSN